ncbi:MAG: FHA domain-containing protein [Gammaproteobacteria bacterium]|nr:FHA domain-containing protein [Gammaproteobacteria bacterium]MDH5778158.1 FHA domain-containing protein [Gammaproteobacteria bacterium]
MSHLTLAFKGRTLRIFPVTPGTMLIGNDPDCDIHIDSLAIQAQHTRIVSAGENSVLYNLAKDVGTYVNHQRAEQHLLKDGDIIRIGKHTLNFAFEAPAQVKEPIFDPYKSMLEIQQPIDEARLVNVPTQDQGWLQVLNGQNLGKTLSLHRSMTNLGKKGVATAVITRRTDGYFISHLEGKYPPLVDDTPIGDNSFKLSDGDTIQIGNIRLQFYLDS